MKTALRPVVCTLSRPPGPKVMPHKPTSSKAKPQSAPKSATTNQITWLIKESPITLLASRNLLSIPKTSKAIKRTWRSDSSA